MEDKKAYNKISIDEISRNSESYVIKDFLLPDQSLLKRPLSFEEPFIFDGFALGLCLQGTGKVKINFKEYEIAAGSILLLLPNQLVKLDNKSDDLVIEEIFLSLDVILAFPSPVDFDLFNHARRNPCIKVPEGMLNHLLEYYRFISSEYTEHDNLYREEIVKTLLYALMLEISGIYKSSEKDAEKAPAPKHEELSDRFFRLLNKHYRQERGVAFYADKMCMTPKYLSNAIKKITGKSIPMWINEAVATEAKIMLRTTTLTISQISEELNFANPSFFVQYFKQHCGTTPLKYRNGR